MTSIVKFEALSGAAYDTEMSPPCYLLEVDDCKLLLDCGWDEHFSSSIVNRIARHVKTIDAVLLSHPDPYHLGLLPYLVGKLGLNCPIFSTVPVSKMGEMFMYDLFASQEKMSSNMKFSLEDVDLAFSKIKQLKYHENHAVLKDLTITPLPAGHMIGGSLWSICRFEEEIVYAVDFNHKSERHLNKSSFLSFEKPSLLIMDALNGVYKPDNRKDRDKQLFKEIHDTFKNKMGNVLMCVDTAGRSLELAYLLDQHWTSQSLQNFSIVLLNSVCSHVLEFAKSSVEWMSESVMKTFDDQRRNPFSFRNVQICQDINSLNNIKLPCCILASQPDLESGFARDLFINWAQDPRNTIIMTQRTSPSTLASQLLNLIGQDNKIITVEISEKMPLQGLELDDYNRQRAKEKEEELKRQKELEDEDSDDEQEESNEGKTHDLLMKEGSFKQRGFFKQAGKSYPMYPCIDNKIKYDDYGEIINPDDFLMFDSTVTTTERVTASSKNEEKKPLEEESIPTKTVTTVLTLNVNCKITFIDFEGRSDSDSLKQIVSSIKPRRLILVKGSPEATEAIVSHCSKMKEFLDKVLTPKIGDVVDATTESHIYQVRLLDSLVSSLSFKQAKSGEQLAWIQGVIDEKQDDQDTLIKDPRKQEDGETRQLVLKQAKTMSPHTTIFVNEVKLSDFKQILIKSGIQAEFIGGSLCCCNQMVQLKKSQAGRIQIEGTLCPSYFKIRDLLYQQYAIL